MQLEGFSDQLIEDIEKEDEASFEQNLSASLEGKRRHGAQVNNSFIQMIK